MRAFGNKVAARRELSAAGSVTAEDQAAGGGLVSMPTLDVFE